MKLKLPKAITPLIERLIAFLTVFVVFSGLIGPRIVGSSILNRDGFGWYGGFGKALLFALIAFALLAYRTQWSVQLPAWRQGNFGWLATATASFAASWWCVGHLLVGQRTELWLVGAHGFLLASVVFALGGCFGPAALRLVVRAYRRELGLAVISGVCFYFLLAGIYALWPVLAGVVLHAAAWLLRTSGLTVAIIPPRTLLLTKFGITVAQYCSGIESLALFSGFYAIVGFLDWKRFNKRRFILVFPAAMLLLFGCNILRVYVLVLAGYYINPHLAFSLFHTYAGMIFFALYSIAFWAVSYRWLLGRPAAN
ncbi:MAG TPA: archaeosortase/exosortase family protein [Candidatus Saccharimonadales bacterium]